MQGIDAVQPDRGGRQSKGETAAAGGNAADKGAEPQKSERDERQSQHQLTQIEREDEADRDDGGGTGGERGQRFFAEVEKLDGEHAQAEC